MSIMHPKAVPDNEAAMHSNTTQDTVKASKVSDSLSLSLSLSLTHTHIHTCSLSLSLTHTHIHTCTQ